LEAALRRDERNPGGDVARDPGSWPTQQASKGEFTVPGHCCSIQLGGEVDTSWWLKTTNPSEKYARQIGNLVENRGENTKYLMKNPT